jgi:signal transduction histidine kinase
MSEQPEPRHDGRTLFAVSSWSLRRKVALALAIPLVLAATLGGLRTAGDLKAAANSSASARQVTVLRPAIDYLTAASRAMVAAQSDTWAGESAIQAAVADLNAAADELEGTRESADLTDEQSRQIDVVLALSRVLREDSRTLSPGTWVAQLRQLQTGVNRLIATIANAQLEPQPRLQMLTEALTGRFSLAMQQALASTSRAGDDASLDLFAELGTESAAIDRLAGDPGEAEAAVTDLLTDNARRTRTVRTGGTDLGGARAFAGYDTLVDTLLEGVDEELAASADAARTRALLNAGLTASSLLAAILLALLVSRLLLTPIRTVREGALAVAHEHLPDAVARIRAGGEVPPITPIDVHTKEEVGQLARAVDDLHRQAVVLAAGEAGLRAQVSEMFVTLSRRNTSLVNQQLGLIDALEKDEEDPARLESLFRLDHLASRMRRTAESLLVLADADAQPTGQQGLTVGEAMQAATAGVQDYQRVSISTNSLTTRIADDVASDVVHLLTELVDNALAYSSPSTSVAVGAAHTPDGVVLDIVDAGLGIPDDTRAELNERLSSGGTVTTDTTRRMGLFVVSRLAQRHGITVQLNRNAQGGTTATVLLPTTVLPELLPRQAEPAHDAPALESEAEASVPEPTTDLPHLAPVSVGELAAQAASPSRLQAVLEGALGSGLQSGPGNGRLPVRRPGANLADSPAALAPVTPTAPETPAIPVAGVASVIPVEAAPEPAAEPARQPADATVASADVATAPVPVVPEAMPPVAVVSEPMTAAEEPAPVATAGRLDPLVAPRDVLGPAADEDDDVDSPIFRSMRSAWLSSGGEDQPWTSSEVEAGWEVAEKAVEAATPEALTPSGLPLRRPGAQLVPGGVTKHGTSVARDPEAIRARLAAHAAGVSRGRRSATTSATSTTPDHPHTEADPA